MKRALVSLLAAAAIAAATGGTAQAASAPHWCHGGEGTNEIWAWPTTSCPFARNVYRAILRTQSNVVYTGDVFHVRAHSPTTHRWYWMRCVVRDITIECSGGRGAHVEVIF